MKEIKAIIRPHLLDAVLGALHAHPELPGVTVCTVRGFGRRVGRSNGDAPVQYGTNEMAKLECVINDDEVDTVVDLIRQAAHTGNPGDGKIFVYEVPFALKIRTGQRLCRFE